MSGMYAKKVLLIISDPHRGDDISERLAPAYEVHRVASPHHARDEIIRVRPDIVALDLGFPDTAGSRLLEELRADATPDVSEVPVVAMCPTGDPIAIQEVLRLAPRDYVVTKVWDPDEVVRKIRRQLGEDAPEAITTAKKKIIIVEDDKFLRDLATQKFQKENMEVFPAVDGETGLALARQEIPDAILLDILLPGMNGYEVLEQVKADPALKKTVVIMLSNYGQREDIEKARSLGADRYLIKANYTLDEIVREVRSFLGENA